MAVLTTDFEVPSTIDRTMIAIQDVIDRFSWMVLDVSPTHIVASTGKLVPLQTVNFPKITARLSEKNGNTNISASISVVGPSFLTTPKSTLSGLLGQFVNSVSLRIQTNSVAINPTVAVGEGQGSSNSSQLDRLLQLETLKRLLDSGALTEDEYANEKAKILNS